MITSQADLYSEISIRVNRLFDGSVSETSELTRRGDSQERRASQSSYRTRYPRYRSKMIELSILLGL